MSFRKALSMVIALPLALSLSCLSPAPGGEQETTMGAHRPAESGIRYALCDKGLPQAGMWKCDPAFGDINRDGHIDLVATLRKGNGPHVFLGDSAGGWRDASEGLEAPIDNSCGGGVALGDVNRDGITDLALADHCHGLFVYLGSASGRWEVVARNLYPNTLPKAAADPAAYRGSEDLDLGDVDGDGALDIVAGATDEGGVSLYLGDGTGRGWTYTVADLPTAAPVNRVRFADTNADGSLDIVAACAEGPRVWHGNGRGGFTAASGGLPSPVVQGLYRGTDVGDMNGDGLLDLVTANWVDGPEVYLQSADGRWTKQPDVFPEMRGGAVGLALADIDGDKDLDIVTSGRLPQDVGFVYGVYILLGDGKGRFTYLRQSGLPEKGLAFTWGVAAADVNRDSIPDIVAGSGGIVGSAPGSTEEPAIPTRLPLWCGSR
jgi:hypothetical protein